MHYVVKLSGIAFTTTKKSFQAFKFQFDWPIPNALGYDFMQSLHSSINGRERKWKFQTLKKQNSYQIGGKYLELEMPDDSLAVQDIDITSRKF